MVGDMVVAAHLDDLLFVERARFHRARREAGSAGQNMVGSTFRDTWPSSVPSAQSPPSSVAAQRNSHRSRSTPPERGTAWTTGR